MRDRYPGYDVLVKRNTPSWNDATRRVIDERLSLRNEPQFLGADEWRTLCAICDRIVPQPQHRPPVALAAMIDLKLAKDECDGYRQAGLPPLREAWRRGLAAIDSTARARYGTGFHALGAAEQDELLEAIQKSEADGAKWEGMPARLFFRERVLHDILAAYYSHPTSWSEIGFGGPASPRGYVRMNFNRRDPWEAVEATPGDEAAARKQNERIK